MKKLLLLAGVFCFTLALNAQNSHNEDFDKIQEQMKENMEQMMKMFEGSFDLSDGSAIKIDTFFFKNFGEHSENNDQMTPGEDFGSFFREIEKMMKERFDNLGFENSIPFEFDETPVVPGPDSFSDDRNKKAPKESEPVKKKKKRKTYSL